MMVRWKPARGGRLGSASVGCRSRHVMHEGSPHQALRLGNYNNTAINLVVVMEPIRTIVQVLSFLYNKPDNDLVAAMVLARFQS